jgi:hypothetical protein
MASARNPSTSGDEAPAVADVASRVVGGTRALGFMQKLSPMVYLYQPSSPEKPKSTDVAVGQGPADPKLVLVLGWLDARDAHLAKYVRQYQEVFPRSAILLVKSRLAGANLDSVGRKDASAAVSPIRAAFPDLDPTGPDSSAGGAPPGLLVHVFSGGGSSSLHHLYDVYAASSSGAATGDLVAKKPVLPRHVTIFDSSPNVFSYGTIVAAVKFGVQGMSLLTRLLMLPFIHLLVSAWWVRIRILRLPDILELYARSHNDAAKVRETRRLYIWSDVDDIVPPADVFRHASAARLAGFDARKVLFAGSGHVAHARAQPERYWRLVKDTWEGIGEWAQGEP